MILSGGTFLNLTLHQFAPEQILEMIIWGVKTRAPVFLAYLRKCTFDSCISGALRDTAGVN